MFKVSRELPDVNTAHDAAQASKEARLQREMDGVLKPQIVAETQAAMRGGYFSTALRQHNHGLHPDSVFKTIEWLKEGGYNAYLMQNFAGCHCSAHIAWSWENKQLRLADKQVVVPILVKERAHDACC